jgi:hypothetical protein
VHSMTAIAILSAKQIRDSGALITDTRAEFAGHADIRHRIVVRGGDPLPAEELIRLRDRAKVLASIANYFADPDPMTENRTGPSLHYKS